MGIFWCAVPTAVHASPIQIFGFWPRDIAMGGAVVAGDPGLGAAYHNPASPGFAQGQQVGIGFSMFSPQLFIERGVPVCSLGPDYCSSIYGDLYSDVASALPEPPALPE